MTADERRRLAEIGDALTLTDPDLDRTLATGRFRRRRVHATGTGLVLASAVVLGVGAGFRDTTVCLLAWGLFALGMLLRFNAD